MQTMGQWPSSPSLPAEDPSLDINSLIDSQLLDKGFMLYRYDENYVDNVGPAILIYGLEDVPLHRPFVTRLGIRVYRSDETSFEVCFWFRDHL